MNIKKCTFYVTIGLVITGIVGCVSNKPLPKALHKDNYTAVTLEKQRSLPPTQKVLTLQKAIDIALANNPDFKSRHYAVVAAWATFYSNLANYSPQADMSFGFTRNEWTSRDTSRATDRSFFKGTESKTQPVWTGNINANWTVWNGLIRTMNMLSSKASAMEAEQLEKDSRRLLIKSVILAYNQILLDRANIRIQKSNEAFQSQMVKETKLKYNAGAAALSEVLNFKILRNNAQNKVITANAAYKTHRFALAALMGLSTANLPTELKFPEIEVPESSEFSLGVDFYLDMAIAQRPDLQAQKKSVEAIRYNLYSSWGAFSPTLDADLNYGFLRTIAKTNDATWANPVPERGDMNFNYGFAANWDIWEGGARIANVRRQQALLEQEKQSLLKKWISVVKEVRTAYVNLKASVAKRKILKQTLQMTEKRRDLVAEEYSAGNVSIATLNQAQRDLIQAESRHITAVINVANNRAKLLAATGSYN